MLGKTIKWSVLTAVVLCVVGGLVFGRELFSYAWSSIRTVRTSIKDAVPMEFELKRAGDLLEEIIPEMQANIRLIAQEEVEVAALKQDLAESNKAISAERGRVRRISGLLAVEQADYAFGDQHYSRAELKHDLARRFDRLKEAEVILAGKGRLLEAREKALHAAVTMLERSRTQKALLEDKVQALASQHRLVQAASAGSRFQVDNSRLAQTEKLLGQIKKRLDVAERVLAHEARFIQPIEVEKISEKDLLTEVSEYLAAPAGEAVAGPVDHERK